MFIFSLKATICAWRLSNGTSSEQEKPETGTEEENLQTNNTARAVFGGVTAEVRSFKD